MKTLLVSLLLLSTPACEVGAPKAQACVEVAGTAAPAQSLWPEPNASAAPPNPKPASAPPRAAPELTEAKRAPGRFHPLVAPSHEIPYEPGSLGADFQAALRADDWQQAAERFQRVLDQHGPKDGEYEDGFQIYHVRSARIELARVYYRRGRFEQADALLRAVLSEP